MKQRLAIGRSILHGQDLRIGAWQCVRHTKRQPARLTLHDHGLLPAIVFAINTATGSIYAGLWFPVIVTAIAALVTLFFLPETKDRDIHA